MADKGKGSNTGKKKAVTSNKGKGRKKDTVVSSIMRSSLGEKRVLNPKRHSSANKSRKSNHR